MSERTIVWVKLTPSLFERTISRADLTPSPYA